MPLGKSSKLCLLLPKLPYTAQAHLPQGGATTVVWALPDPLSVKEMGQSKGGSSATEVSPL